MLLTRIFCGRASLPLYATTGAMRRVSSRSQWIRSAQPPLSASSSPHRAVSNDSTQAASSSRRAGRATRRRSAASRTSFTADTSADTASQNSAGEPHEAAGILLQHFGITTHHSQSVPATQEASGQLPHVSLPSNPSYDSLYKKSFVNPFNGKLIAVGTPVAQLLHDLGFRQDVSNPLHLRWSPEAYLTQMRGALERLSKRRTKKNTEHAAVTIETVLQVVLRRLEQTAVSWRKELAVILRRPDVLTAMPAEVTRRYAALTGAYMPPKLDAITDPAVSEAVLTPDQAHVTQLAMRGYHMYIGGSAGTGKTVLLKYLYRSLTQQGLRVALTATTGVAAVQLGGCTFHHAFNAPLDSTACSTVRRWDTNALRAVDVIIIDEVSLLDAQMFDAFDMEARLARTCCTAFGGIQVIVCGDFLQLSIGAVHDSLPVYLSAAFRYLRAVRLTTPMRHLAQEPLLAVLNAVRRGHFPRESFRQLDREIPADASQVTFLFPRRREAQLLNDAMLNELQTSEMTCAPQRGPLHRTGLFTSSAFVQLAEDTEATPARLDVVAIMQEEVLRVCPQAGTLAEHDCVVMPAKSVRPSLLLCLRHSDRAGGAALASLPTLQAEARLGRGAAALSKAAWQAAAAAIAARLGGHLLRFYDTEPAQLVPLAVSMALADMNKIDVVEALMPLRLRLGCRVMINRNLSRTVSNGSVGLVEAFSPPDMDLFPRRAGISDRGLYQHILRQRLFPRLPVVRLLSGEVVQIPPIPSPLGGTALTYYYGHDVYTLPLQLGYGFTVHKVQGLTLQGTVVLDCEHFFECPHLIYVACSRVRRMDQLIVRNIEPNMVIVKRSALEFSEGLQDAKDVSVLAVTPDAIRASWAVRMSHRVYSLGE